MERRGLYVVPSAKEEPKKKRPVKRGRKWLLFLLLLLALAAAGGVFYFQTYTNIQVLDTYAIANAADSSYEMFLDGVLKYSRDGVSYLDRKGEEQWNQSYQMKDPFVSLNDASAVVADRGGNDMMVFQEEGLKGEIHTTLPIEKATVSEQGIVGAVLKSSSTPMVMCYDMVGNILVEQKASMAGNGYPVDIALSDNGEVMQVVYLAVENGSVSSKVGYYNFGSIGEGKTDHQVFLQEYGTDILAAGFYMDHDYSAVVGEHSLMFFHGKDEPEEEARIDIGKDIQSICHNGSCVGLMLKNEGESGYEIRIYHTSGKMIMSRTCLNTYSHTALSGFHMLMYDGSKFCIYTITGQLRFEGDCGSNILGLFPKFGLNRYILLDANGMEGIRLIK